MPIDTKFNEAEAMVAEAWRARCGDRRGPLEQADVDAIAEAAFQTPGVKPTVELIRRIAGGGSPNTIHPNLDAWFRRSREAVGVTGVPAELMSLWERLQSATATAARGDLQPMIDALAADRGALDDDRRRLATDQATLATERATTAALVADLREEFRVLQARNDELAALNAQLRQTGQADAIELLRRHEANEAGKTALATAGAETARLDVALARVVADGTQHREERDAAREALLRAQARIVSLENNVGELEARESDANQRRAELAEVLTQVRSEAEQQAALHRDLRQEVALAHAAVAAEQQLREHLANDLARERTALTDAQAGARDATQALAATRAHLTAVTAERDHLHARLEAWATGRSDAERGQPSSGRRQAP